MCMEYLNSDITLCENPNQVKRAMRQAMKMTTARMRAEYITDLLKQLMNLDLGTSDVMNNVNKVYIKEKTRTRKAIIRIVMKDKIRQAHKDLRRLKYEETKYWRENKSILQGAGIIDLYEEEWMKEKATKREMYKERRKSKIEWMKKKYRTDDEMADEYQGVTIKDQDISNSFEKEYKVYGNVELNENEKAALSLHPKYTTFEKVDLLRCEAEFEKALTKLRWKEKTSIDSIGDTEATYTDDAYEFKKQIFNFRKARATNLPFNVRTNMPSKLEERREIPLQELKLKLKEVTEEYIKCNETRMTNLSPEEKEGLKSLIKRRDNKEIIMNQTDKSGKMSIDTVSNYVDSSIIHFQDKRISKVEVRFFENEVNAHATFWVRMLQAGKGNNDNGRYESSMRSHFSKVAEAYTFRKDHKKYDDEVKGPPVRPLCDGSDSIIRRFSFLISKILQEVNVCKESACDSTEDMLAAIKESNEVLRETNKKVTIGSADVKALYPSLDIPYTIEIVCEEFYKSEIEFEGIDEDELGLYLSLNRGEMYLKEKGLYEYCPYRNVRARGPKPKITSSGIETSKERRFRLWKTRQKEPNKDQVKLMMKEAFKIALELILNNHIYIFNDEMKIQQKGGPIGLDITGVIAKIFMCWWDDEFLKRLKNANVSAYLYKRYVDDMNTCVDVIEAGMKWKDGRLIYDASIVEEEAMKEDDMRTFQIVKQIGDEIHHSIQLEIDVPSNHKNDNKIPILDLKVWVETERIGDKVVNKILHEFYIKDVSSKFLINANSTLSWRNKITIITQQCLRILLNCSPELKEETVCNHLNFFMKRMQASGYNKKTRLQVLKSALKAYEDIKKKEESGIRPMYRKKTWRHCERRKERIRKRRDWYTKGQYESVMFLPATPNSELKKLYDEEIKKRGIKMRIVEKSGMKIKNLLQRNSLLNKKQCDGDCFICNTSEKGNCMSSGVVYEVECKFEHTEGKYKYTGRTMKNGYSRGREHMNKYIKKHEDSMMWKHCVEKHDCQEQEFSMKVKETCRNDPTLLQILEALHIKDNEGDASLNSRTEWNYVNLI